MIRRDSFTHSHTHTRRDITTHHVDHDDENACRETPYDGADVIVVVAGVARFTWNMDMSRLCAATTTATVTTGRVAGQRHPQNTVAATTIIIIIVVVIINNDKSLCEKENQKELEEQQLSGSFGWHVLR